MSGLHWTATASGARIVLPKFDGGSTCERSRVDESCCGRYIESLEMERPRILGYGQLRVLTLLHAGLPFLHRS
jgi:hypothetical protein